MEEWQEIDLEDFPEEEPTDGLWRKRLDALPMPAFVISATGVATGWNEAAERAFGISKGEDHRRIRGGRETIAKYFQIRHRVELAISRV